MSRRPVLHEILASPNNMKVRAALNYKGIGFDRRAIAPLDRSALIELSGQPRTPVLEVGDLALFGSGAILRYLDAAWPSTPKLFTDDYAGFGEIERWEDFGRVRLERAVGMAFGEGISGRADAGVLAEANRLLREATGELEEHLDGREWLYGDAMSAADLSCAPMAFYGMTTEEITEVSPIAGFFRQHVTFGEGRDRTRAWVERVMAYDRLEGCVADEVG